MKIFLAAFLFIAAFGATGLWLTDQVTWQDEVTVYTARCVDGTWDGGRCSGRLAPGDRYRYRALRRRSEVLFWVLGEDSPSRKMTGCEVVDGRNWTCRPTDDAAHSVTLAMKRGRATHDATGVARPFHGITKLKWYALKMNLPLRSATY